VGRTGKGEERMIAQHDSKFPPEQVKEMIGQLSVATARSTEPANKLSLTSSRISTLKGVIEYKCREWMMPGLKTLLYTTIQSMMEDMKEDDHEAALHSRLDYLIRFLGDVAAKNIQDKTKSLPDESLDLLTDYNNIVLCRERWKKAQDIYMHNNEAWSISNKMLADINDILTSIELKYNLIIMPKNYSYDIHDLNMLNKQE
jgi:hypothetical protein